MASDMVKIAHSKIKPNGMYIERAKLEEYQKQGWAEVPFTKHESSKSETEATTVETEATTVETESEAVEEDDEDYDE